MNRNIQGRRVVIKPLKRGFSPIRNMGFDTETYIDKNGMPQIFTLQFFGEDFPGELIECDNRTALPNFMAVLDEWAKPGIVNAVWGHNIPYDLTALLLNYPNWIEAIANGYLKIEWATATLEIFAGNSWFGKIRFSDNRTVWLADSFKFTFAGLEASAKMFNLSIRKLVKPLGLGERKLKSTAFKEYAMQDAIVEFHLAEIISDMHAKLDVPFSISAAQLSARVFRRKFLDMEFKNPPPDIEDMAIKSFHGGISTAIPGYYPELTEYDITSAYPSAMINLGVPTDYEYITEFGPLNAVYHIFGKTSDRKYPILFNEKFQPLLKPDYAFVTGFELESAMRHGEFKGHVLRGVRVKLGTNPFKPFVDFFFHEKDAAKQRGDIVSAHFFKRILNSLYGKMIQSTPIPESSAFAPGGLWCPFLASLITGKVRARLHDLEHDCAALHSSTDAVKTSGRLETGIGLGKLTREISGPCLIVRPKLYAHKDSFSGHWKFASHGLGVWPPVKAWQEILTTGGTHKRRVVMPKTAKVRGLNVLTWIDATTQTRSPIPPAPPEFLAEILDIKQEI